jgi:hypothetical protein
MRVSLFKMFAGLLVVTLMTPAALVQAAGSDVRQPGLQASVERAARTLALDAAPAVVPPQASVPRTLRRSGKTSKQASGGGGSMMMVMGLVSTVAGLAGTYYVVKMMKDQNKDVTTAAGGLR